MTDLLKPAPSNLVTLGQVKADERLAAALDTIFKNISDDGDAAHILHARVRAELYAAMGIQVGDTVAMEVPLAAMLVAATNFLAQDLAEFQINEGVTTGITLATKMRSKTLAETFAAHLDNAVRFHIKAARDKRATAKKGLN